MIKIGELAKMFNVSVKTIRFYETKNVLNPCEVDRWTGYRYYDENSIKQLSSVLFLKKLGFSLNEIKDLTDEQIKEKTLQVQHKINEMLANLKTLSILSKNNLGELNMKKFINDERVIGKWKKIGIVKNKQDLQNNKIQKNNIIFPYEFLYFMPEGKPYWVFSWTKETLFIKERACKYEIIEDKMIIGIADKNNNVDEYAVYKKIDNKKYEPAEIKIKDNTNIPFVNDINVIGFYEAVDFVPKKELFLCNEKYCKEKLFWNKLTIEPNGVAVCTFNEKQIVAINWSKGVLINKHIETVSEYEIKEDNGGQYLIVEWKSGDYSYGGKVNGFYVFKKVLI